jgi:hypothetical protein
MTVTEERRLRVFSNFDTAVSSRFTQSTVRVTVPLDARPGA